MRIRTIVCALAVFGLPAVAGAVGGDDGNTGTKVNLATQLCQAEIAKKGALYASSAAKALTCRRTLLRPGTGKCAVGKLDEGAELTGVGAAAHADSLPLYPLYGVF